MINQILTKRRPPIILCFVTYYLPGYRAGGPVRTIANFVDHLGDDFEILIVTRDRDLLDTKPYADVVVDGWNRVGKALVFYGSEKTVNLRGIARLLRGTSHDVLYLNSFFDPWFSTLPLLARRLGLAPGTQCVIASRGEFSAGAIALKAWKKRSFMVVAKLLGLHARVRWQASSECEEEDIQRELGEIADSIEVAPDLPPRVRSAVPVDSASSPRNPGPLRIVFLSRISPMKNLDFLLSVLRLVKSQLHLVIYGPVEDEAYWNRCQSLIDTLPGNLSVVHGGEVTPLEVLDRFSGSDLFVFPTRGENYGHVVLESLAAGTPVLLSDRTPWQASEDKAVEVLPLENPAAWVEVIERWTKREAHELERMRSAAQAYAQRYLESSEAVAQNRALFSGAASAANNGAGAVADK